VSSVTKFYGVKVICLPAKCTTLPGLPSAMAPTPFSRTLASSRSSLELANERCGIYDRKISIVLKDDKYEPDGAVQNTNELIEKGEVPFPLRLRGHAHAYSCVAAVEVLREGKIVNVAPFTGADPQRKPLTTSLCLTFVRRIAKKRALWSATYMAKGYRRIGFLG